MTSMTMTTMTTILKVFFYDNDDHDGDDERLGRK